MRRLKSHYLLYLISIAMVTLGGCEKETEILPYAKVNYSITISPGLSDLGVNGLMVLPTTDQYDGVGGLILYRADVNYYIAFDRACPNEKSETCVVGIDDSEITVSCPCCGSVFIFTYDGCMISEGPASYPLKAYQTTKSGNYLYITN